MRYDGQAGFHAGDHAWAVFQEAPGQPYRSRLLKISLASRCGDKIAYQLPLCGILSENRVFFAQEEAERAVQRLNKRQQRSASHAGR